MRSDHTFPARWTYRIRERLRGLSLDLRQQPGRTTLTAGLVPPDSGSVLQLGCDSGATLLEIARAYPCCRLFAVDPSRKSIHRAEKLFTATALAGRVQLSVAHPEAFVGAAVFGIPAYDRIVASYILSSTPRWVAVVDNALRHLAPNGSLHVLDYASPAATGLGRASRLSSLRQSIDIELELRRRAFHQGFSVFSTRLGNGEVLYAVLTHRQGHKALPRRAVQNF